MGKLILCSGKLATTPYHFPFTNTDVYSIEELCYYIYENIYLVNEDMFTRELTNWLEKEAGMAEFAEKLRTLISNRHSIKDLVVSILCSGDYYSEDEIKSLVVIIDQIMNLDPLHRLKLKADNYLKYKNYRAAANAYDEIKNSKDAALLTEKELGDLLHNRAMIDIHNLSFSDAAEKLKAAYKCNQNEESLNQYFYALHLSGNVTEFNQSVKEFKVKDKDKEALINFLNEMEVKAKEHDIYKKMQTLFEKEQEQEANSKNELKSLINGWKQDYRQEGYYEII